MGKRKDTIWIAAWPHGESLDTAKVEMQTFDEASKATAQAMRAAVEFKQRTKGASEALVLAVYLPLLVRLLSRQRQHKWAIREAEAGRRVKIVMEVR